MRHILIVGAGISGIASALILSRKGYAVTLVEKSSRLSPTLRGFHRKGVYFDTGLHLTGGLGAEGVLDRFFRYLGIDNLDYISLNCEAYSQIIFSEQERLITLPVGAHHLHQELTRQFPQSADAISTYVSDVRNICRRSPFLTLTGERISPPNYPNLSLASYLRKLTSDHMLQATLSIHCLLHGVSPSQVPFAQHALIAGSYFDAAHTIRNGGKALIKALEARLQAQGVTTLCGSGVSMVETESSGQVKAVMLNSGQRIPCDTILYTAHPSGLCPLFPAGTFRPAFTTRLASLEDTPSAHILFGKTESPLALLTGKNLFICPTIDLETAFNPTTPPQTGPFYIAAAPHEPLEAQSIVAIAPGSLIQYHEWRHSHSQHRPPAYREFKASTLTAINEAMLSFEPSLAQVEWLDGASPLTLRDYMHTPSGSLYGCQHSLSQFNPQPATRLPGVWLAGQSVVAPGILGAMVSAFLACGLMTDLDTLLKEVYACS